MPSAQHLHHVLVSERVGGAELVAVDIAKGLRRADYRVTGWAPGQGASFDLLGTSGIRRGLYPLDRLSRGGVGQVMALATTAPRWLSRQPSIVHIHDPLVYALLSPALRLLPLRTVVHFHIDPTLEQMNWALRHPPDAVVACSRHIADVLSTESRGAGSRLGIAIAPNAVDCERFAPPRDHRAAKLHVEAPLDRPLLVNIANIAEHKGQDTVVRAVAALRDLGTNCECWLAGEDRGESSGYSERLKDMIHELNLDGHVRMLGFRRDLAEILQAADALILPSTREGLPLVVLEAQASGVPVIASPLPGIKEVVEDGVTGYLVASDDATAYAERIHALVTDPALHRRIAASALGAVRETRGWSAYLKRIVGVYEAVTA